MVFIVATDPGVRIEQASERFQQIPTIAGLTYGGSLSAWMSAFKPFATPVIPSIAAPIVKPMRSAAFFQVTQVRTFFQTEDSYDLAIQGHGFLKVTTQLGQTAYTRDGALQVSAKGELMTASGALVQPVVTIPQDALDVAISKTGEVQVKLPGAAQLQTVGQIKIATFANEAGLEATDQDRFVETTASGPATVDAPGTPGFGTVLQGYVEAADTAPVVTLG